MSRRRQVAIGVHAGTDAHAVGRTAARHLFEHAVVPSQEGTATDGALVINAILVEVRAYCALSLRSNYVARRVEVGALAVLAGDQAVAVALQDDLVAARRRPRRGAPFRTIVRAREAIVSAYMLRLLAVDRIVAYEPHRRVSAARRAGSSR